MLQERALVHGMQIPAAVSSFFFAAESARIAVALGRESSKLPGKFLLIACLAIIFIDCCCSRRVLGLARTTAKNFFHHLFEWECNGASKMLDNLRVQ